MSLSHCLSPALVSATRTATTLNISRVVTTAAIRSIHTFHTPPRPFSHPTPLRSYSTTPPSPPGRLQNKIAIVTGSSAGIGRAIALAYAREGAKVLCSDLQPLAKVNIGDETHIATHDLIMREGGLAAFWKADVSEAESVEELVNQGVEIWGRVDIMVNNAGIAMEMEASSATSAGEPIHLTPISTYDKTMKVNARGAFLGTKYAVKQMMKQDLGPGGDRGWIVNLASIAGLVGFNGAPAYCSSKGAIIQLTKQVALDYGPYKIHVNAICPGAIQTAMVKPFSENEAFASNLIAQHPWGKLGEPKQVAGAAVFLASEDAAFVTGVALPVDGGFTAH